MDEKVLLWSTGDYPGSRDKPSHECETDSHPVVSHSLGPRGLYSPRNSPGQNAGVGSLSLLQRIFPTQGLNRGLLHCRQILCQLSYQGSPNVCPDLPQQAHPACSPGWFIILVPGESPEKRLHLCESIAHWARKFSWGRA